MLNARIVCVCVAECVLVERNIQLSCMVCGHTERAHTNIRTHSLAKRKKKAVAQLRRMPVDVLRGAHYKCIRLCGACSSAHTNTTQTACECEIKKKWRKMNEAWKSLCTWICETEHENNATDRYYVLILFACFFRHRLENEQWA